MNVLFDIGHPAHVHLFKNFIMYLIHEGHNISVVTRKKDITEALLEHYQIPFLSLSKPKKSKLGMMLELFERDYKILKLHKEKKFDLSFGTSVSIGHLTLLKGVPSYNFNEDDDETVPLFVKISYPYNTKIVNPDVIEPKRYSEKRVFHKSYHELAYLHPNNFFPDESILSKYSLRKGEYIVIRKAALKAHHDKGAKGLSDSIWKKIIGICSRYQLVLSFEGNSSHDIDPWDMHNILAFARFLITDGLSMSIEAAVLGTPSIRYNSFEGKSAVLKNVDSYGLSFGFNADDEKASELFLRKVTALLGSEELKIKAKDKRDCLLKDKIDLNQYIINLFKGVT